MRNADDTYDALSLAYLEKRLKRRASEGEIVNADFDSDVINETLWEMVKSLWNRVEELEKSMNVDETPVIENSTIIETP